MCCAFDYRSIIHLDFGLWVGRGRKRRAAGFFLQFTSLLCKAQCHAYDERYPLTPLCVSFFLSLFLLLFHLSVVVSLLVSSSFISLSLVLFPISLSVSWSLEPIYHHQNILLFESLFELRRSSHLLCASYCVSFISLGVQISREEEEVWLVQAVPTLERLTN